MKGVVGEVINNTRSSLSRFPQDKYHKLVWKSTLKLIYFNLEYILITKAICGMHGETMHH